MAVDLRESCILETLAGKKLLFSRYLNETNAQVHDGENILAMMFPVYLGKRGQNWSVTTYGPKVNSTAPMLTQSYHGTRAAAHAKMERLAIRQYRERGGE